MFLIFVIFTYIQSKLLLFNFQTKIEKKTILYTKYDRFVILKNAKTNYISLFSPHFSYRHVLSCLFFEISKHSQRNSTRYIE